MAKNIRKNKINNKDVSYLNRDFDSFRNELIRYARVHYGETVLDFSEASMAGMFVDLAAYVGDIMSFYQDHQFNELSLETAVEDKNIERLVRDSGVQITGSSPALVDVNLKVRVDALTNAAGAVVPDPNLMPIIRRGSVVASSSGIEFQLLEDVDFSEKDEAGELVALVEIGSADAQGIPKDYFLTMMGIFTSAKEIIETFAISDSFEPFRTITLKSKDVNEIIRVSDSDGDEYYEVENLTQDTVYIQQKNDLQDYLSVPQRLKMIPAPKRFETSTNRKSVKTTLRFGSGDENLFDEDVIPDPSEHAIKMYGDRKTLNFVSIDPNSFLSTTTLGISPRNTTLTIKYRAGGGVKHNVAASQIVSIRALITKFQESISSVQVSKIRASVTCINKTPAAGGEDQLTLQELRQIALSSQNAQGRIVTREDLMARVYSMPNRFGRVFRAGIRDNPSNPFSSHLHVLSRDAEGKLTFTSDSLKENLSIFLENYRLITDAIDIVDGKIINIGINYGLSCDPKFNTSIVLQSVNFKLQSYFDIRNFQIDQPIMLSELQNIILNTAGVVSMLSMNIVNLSGHVGANNYSDESYDPFRYKDRGILYPPPGSMFEVKYPDDDIKGRVK